MRHSFQFLSLFTMNIFFWENLVLIGVLFLVVPYAGGRSENAKGPEESGSRKARDKTEKHVLSGAEG